MIAPTACPSCSGPSQPEHPGGPLAGWHHLQTCSLLAAEDARAVADADVLAGRITFAREATATERTLLAALGHSGTDAPGLRCRVRQHTPGVRLRHFPDTTPPAPTTEGA